MTKKAAGGGVIWDMDGVIADTAPYHFRAWQKVFSERGVAFTESDFKSKFGQRNDSIIQSAFGAPIPQAEIEVIAREKEETFRSLVKANIRALPGVIELLESLSEHGFKMALASSAPMENIQLITGALGIRHHFQAIVSGHEVVEGKPSPLGFLLAASRLGLEPCQCVVIEDAIVGIMAAKQGGMGCVAVATTHSPGKLSDADLVVESLEKVAVSDIERLLNHLSC